MALTEDSLFKSTEKVGVMTSGKLPTVKSLEDKLAAIDKKTMAPAHLAMEKLVEKAKAVSKDDRKAFDKNLSEMTNKVGAFVKAATTLDSEIKALDKTLNKLEDADKKVLAVSKSALTPVQHRETLRKVAGSLETLSKEKAKVDKTNLHQKTGTETEPDAPVEGGSMGAVVGVIVGLVVVGLGVGYCKYSNKFCFKKDDDPKEGGDADKNVYKKEVKSKNSHKRHAKESLMPSFKVSEEEA
jgi:polyhydroxyalkanoate synthesis regulator phasin